MAERLFDRPPPNTILCGGKPWAEMSYEAREELWLMHAYIESGGKKVHGSFQSFAARAHTTHGGPTSSSQRPSSEGE